MTHAATDSDTLELTGDGLTLDDAEHILRGTVERLTLAPAARIVSRSQTVTALAGRIGQHWPIDWEGAGGQKVVEPRAAG